MCKSKYAICSGRYQHVANRVRDIIDCVELSMILTTEKLEQCRDYKFLDVTQEEVCEQKTRISEKDLVKLYNVFYIIFISESPGDKRGLDNLCGVKLLFEL